MVYEIQEGDAALVARINFVGNQEYSDSKLQRVVATKEQAWYRHPLSDQFDPERLAFDRELLRRFYLRNGYADVQMNSATAELAPDRSGFFITYILNEGPRYRVGKVDVDLRYLRNLDAASSAAWSISTPGTGTTATASSASRSRCRTRSTSVASPLSTCSRAIQRNKEERRSI